MAEYDDLIQRIQGRAHDPRSATDMGPGRDALERTRGVSTSSRVRRVLTQIYHSVSRATATPTANPPVTPKELEAAERVLGFSLPPLLRTLYLQVGNGGFGPGYGLLRLNRRNPRNQFEESAVSLYQVFSGGDPEYPEWRWPAGLLPICDWGCALRSCVDCTGDRAPVLRVDPEALADGDQDAFQPEADSLYDWLEAWVEDRVSFWPPFVASR